MKLVQAVKNSFLELKKVKWPTRSQLHNSAIVVMIASLLFALVVVVIDLFFENVMQLIYSILY